MQRNSIEQEQNHGIKTRDENSNQEDSNPDKKARLKKSDLYQFKHNIYLNIKTSLVKWDVMSCQSNT